MEPKQQIEQLTRELEHAGYLYYVLDNPEMSDYDYDHKLRQLEELEAQYPQYASPLSPTRRVGGQALSEFVKVRHAVPLESLQDVFSFDELRDYAKAAGVRVALNGYLEAIEEGLVILEDGRGFEAAVVVCAAGIKSVTKLARGLGAECNNAVVVDEHMHTSLPDVWAAGDCVEYQGRVYGLWTASMAQGAVAGACAAGADKKYQPERPGYMMNAMGTKVWSYGDILAEDGLSARDIVAMHFIKLFFDQGALVGAEMIGDTSRMLAVKKAVDVAMSKAEAIKEFLPTRSRGN